MDDSDEDYIENSVGDADYLSDDGISKRTRRRGDRIRGKKGASAKNGSRGGSGTGGGSIENLKGASGGYAWEDEYHRSWDVVQEDEGGSLAGVVAGLVEAKKKRIMQGSTPFQRGIIRNLILVLDMSFAMTEKDLLPNRYQMTLSYAIDFVTEYFDQNPISQLGIVGMRDGLAVLLSDVGGSPHEHVEALQLLRKDEAKGDPSLQNALEMARGLLYHVAPHCTREVLVVFGALYSSDPGDIHKTINDLVTDNVRVRVIGLAAQVAICKELCKRTNYEDQGTYGVVLNDVHFKELFMEATIPLAVNTLSSAGNNSTLVEMGFPSRISELAPSFCACHSNLDQGGYICPRCKTKVCNLPCLCPCCNLTLILSTHLARSYHHLFPLQPFSEVPLRTSYSSSYCYSCHIPFPDSLSAATSSRYRCPLCQNHFCIDCDVFCHETLHNCPGCQARAHIKNPSIRISLKPSKPELEPELSSSTVVN